MFFKIKETMSSGPAALEVSRVTRAVLALLTTVTLPRILLDFLLHLNSLSVAAHRGIHS